MADITDPLPGGHTLVGTEADDLISGLDGNDQLYGQGGNDTLGGGGGTDTAISMVVGTTARLPG